MPKRADFFIAFRKDLVEIGCSSKRGDEQYLLQNREPVKASKAPTFRSERGAARTGGAPSVRSVIADQRLVTCSEANVFL